MNVLLIAPDTGLDYVTEEVQAVVNALHPTLLQGNVTTSEVMAAMHRHYDLVWIATHADEQGIRLSDDFLTASRLVQFLRHPGADGIYLNTCDSLQIASDLHEELHVPVICTVTGVPDDTAYATGAQLAMHLGRGASLREAYELSKPGFNTIYRLIGNGSGIPQDRIDGLIDMVTQIGTDLRGDIRGVEERMNSRLDGIEGDIARRFDAVESRFQFRLTRRHTMMWATGFLLFSIVMALGYVDVRHALNISWQASLIISLPLLAMSGGLIAASLGMPWSLPLINASVLALVSATFHR